MQTINKHQVFQIAKEYAEKKFNKDSVYFTDEEEEYYNGYTAGLLEGLRMAGVSIEEL
jgi:hypothetical protein